MLVAPMLRSVLLTPLQSLALFLWRPLYGPPQAASAEPNRRREQGELVSLAFTVCLALFLVKIFIAFRDLDRDDMPPTVCMDGFWVSVAQVWACCAQDFAVGLGCVLVGGIVLRLLRSHGVRRSLRIVAHIAAALALCYMIVNAQIYHVLRRFMTFSLFQLGGGFKPERSIFEYATPSVKAALALVPLLALALHLLWVHQLPRFWSSLAWLVARPLVLVGGIVGLSFVTIETQRTLFREHRGDFTENPHLLLARSLIWDMEFGDVGPEPPETAEFEPNQPRLSGLTLAKRPTNVIVIVLECAACTYLSNYDYPQETTPCLRELGPRSVTFDRFHATANHTIASALPLCGSLWNDPWSISTLIEFPRFQVPAASSWLQQHGYQTAFLGAGGYRAWEGYRNLYKSIAVTGWDLTRDETNPFWAEGGDRKRFLSQDYLDQAMFTDAGRYLQKMGKDGGTAGKKPFFLLLWNYETHGPYFGWGGGPEWDKRHFPPMILGREQEEEFVRFLNSLHKTDRLIGELYRELEKQGLADDTLVVVTADHGEAFGQHGCFMHGDSLFDEEVRVPLILINRPLADAVSTRSNVIGSHIDIWATIADICGFPFNPVWQGRSLLGGKDADRRAYFARRGAIGVREGRFKYIWDYEVKREYLFDLEADPAERANLAGEKRDYCLRQRRRLRDWKVYQNELTKEHLLEATQP